MDSENTRTNLSCLRIALVKTRKIVELTYKWIWVHLFREIPDNLPV